MSKTIVITGGTGGIGRHTAIALARQGARVVITGRDRVRGEEALRAMSAQGDLHLALGDLSLHDGRRALAEAPCRAASREARCPGGCARCGPCFTA